MDSVIVATIRDWEDHQVGQVVATRTGDNLIFGISGGLPSSLELLNGATVKMRLDGTLDLTDTTAKGNLGAAVESLSDKQLRLVYDVIGVEHAQQLQFAIYKTQPHDCFAADLARPSRTS